MRFFEQMTPIFEEERRMRAIQNAIEDAKAGTPIEEALMNYDISIDELENAELEYISKELLNY